MPRLDGRRCTGRAELIDDPGPVLAVVERLVKLYDRKKAGRRIAIGLDTIPPSSRDELTLAPQGRVVIRLTLDRARAHRRPSSWEGSRP